MTQTATQPATGSRPTTVTRPVMRLLWQVSYPSIVGYVLVMSALFVLVGAGQATLGHVENSIWDAASQSPKYFNVAVGIILTPAALTTLVAYGVTRRAFALVGSAFLAVVALGASVYWAAGYLVEKVIYDIGDWPQTFNTMHLFDSPAQSWAVGVEYFPLILAHQVTGWLLGTSFTRLGWWRGLAFLPVAVLPAVAAELLLLTQWAGELLVDDSGWDRLPLPVAVPGVLLACAAGLYGNYLLLRTIGLKPTRG